jgi:hypothetical protein
LVACGWRLGERESDVPPGVRLNVPLDVPLVAQLDVEKAPQQAVVEHFADGPLGLRCYFVLAERLGERCGFALVLRLPQVEGGSDLVDGEQLTG